MATFAVVALLALGSLQLTPLTSAQSSTSCPASETMHFTFYGGIPTSFNNLGPFNPPGVFAQLMSYLSAGAANVYPDGTPAPYMNVPDVIAHNANYTVWQVHIKPGLKWSTGRNVSSTDYLNVFSANFALNPNYDPVGLHSEITSVNSINSSTTQFTLNQTDAHFAERLDSYFTSNLYPTEFTTTSLNVTTNGFGLSIGDGPFYIDNYTAGQSEMIMLRNPYFQPQPKVCEIIWNYVESIASTATYLAAGTTDFAPVSPNSIPALLKNPNIRIVESPGEWLSYLQYNVSVYPYNMTAFRQALVYGINQSQLAQLAFYNYATPAYNGEGTIRPNTTWYNPNQATYSYDPTKAAQLLSSIGLNKGSDGKLHFANGTAVSFALFADSANSADPVMAQFISQALGALGMQVTVQINSLSTEIGLLFSNGQNIQHNMVLETSEGIVNTPYYMSQNPAYTWEVPGPTPDPFVAPASANAQYLSNVSAITATDNQTLEGQYINNIQNIYSQYLPTVPLLFVDNTGAVSTARFTGWPSLNGYMFGDGFWNVTSLVNLAPVTQTTTSSGPVPSTTTSASAPPTSITSTSSVHSTTSTASVPVTTTTGGSSAVSTSPSIIAVLAAVIVVAAGVLAFSRKRSPDNGKKK